MTEEKQTSLYIKLSKSLKDEFKEYAKKQHSDVSKLVRVAIIEYMENHPIKED